jgi:hypothetical protein
MAETITFISAMNWPSFSNLRRQLAESSGRGGVTMVCGGSPGSQDEHMNSMGMKGFPPSPVIIPLILEQVSLSKPSNALDGIRRSFACGSCV